MSAGTKNWFSSEYALAVTVGVTVTIVGAAFITFAADFVDLTKLTKFLSDIAAGLTVAAMFMGMYVLLLRVQGQTEHVSQDDYTDSTCHVRQELNTLSSAWNYEASLARVPTFTEQKDSRGFPEKFAA